MGRFGITEEEDPVKIELYLNGRNLTNDRYIGSRLPFGARPGAPLWLMGGLRGEF